MIHITILLLLSSLIVTPIHASPNYYAALLPLQDTFDTALDDKQDNQSKALDIAKNSDNQADEKPLHMIDQFVEDCKRDLVFATYALQQLAKSDRTLTPMRGRVVRILPRHVVLAQRNDAELNNMLRQLRKQQAT